MSTQLRHTSPTCHEVYLSFSVPPIVEAASPEMQINVSEPAILVCLITGFPLPSIAWQKNGEDLSADFMRINIFEFEVVSNESGSDSGSGISYVSSGFTGNGSIADLLRLEIVGTYS